jgi:transcriptional regulator with GAF, ATPase, and Fis domain
MRFGSADGAIFLDEIGDISPNKLLHEKLKRYQIPR